MRLLINATNRGTHQSDIHQLYQWLFWDVSILHEYELEQELQRQDIWKMITPFGQERRARAELDQSPLLKEFCQQFDRLHDTFFSMIKDDKFFQWRWTQAPTSYFARTSMVTAIFKDMPGHVMQPHLDNNHVMMQTVINLVDNPSSTDIYSFADSKPIYHSSKEQHRGVSFLNTPGAVHAIRNPDSDRYILYSALMYP